jgi:hypothetical protein
MLWMASVPSLRYHVAKIAASAAAARTVDTAYGMPSSTWTPSAAMVPKTLTISTASQ